MYIARNTFIFWPPQNQLTPYISTTWFLQIIGKSISLSFFSITSFQIAGFLELSPRALGDGQWTGVCRLPAGCLPTRREATLHRARQAGAECFHREFQWLRDECLNEHWFISLGEAREMIEAWRREYNESRPHRALGERTPNEFAGHSSSCRRLTSRLEKKGTAHCNAELCAERITLRHAWHYSSTTSLPFIFRWPMPQETEHLNSNVPALSAVNSMVVGSPFLST
jgi:hypothetical protein